MSTATEKIMKQIQEYIQEKAPDGAGLDDLNRLANEFITLHNQNSAGPLTEKTAETADDFMELASEAEDEARALKFAKKALALDPDHIDAAGMVAELGAKDAFDRLGRLRKTLEKAAEKMKADGFMDPENEGHFWGILETRPYMRLRQSYTDALINCGMYSLAARECEDMLRLCRNDNLGIRHTLMHLYVLLEDEEKAEALLKRFDEFDETQLLLPMSILYFKLARFEKARAFLDRLVKLNKDARKFIRAVADDTLEDVAPEISPYGYRPDSMEELFIELHENQVLFLISPAYFRWARDQFKKRK